MRKMRKMGPVLLALALWASRAGAMDLAGVAGLMEAAGAAGAATVAGTAEPVGKLVTYPGITADVPELVMVGQVFAMEVAFEVGDLGGGTGLAMFALDEGLEMVRWRVADSATFPAFTGLPVGWQTGAGSFGYGKAGAQAATLRLTVEARAAREGTYAFALMADRTGGLAGLSIHDAAWGVQAIRGVEGEGTDGREVVALTTQRGHIVNVEEYAPVHSGPDSGYVVGAAYLRHTVKMIQWIGDWCQVLYNNGNNIGWVYGEYIAPG